MDNSAEEFEDSGSEGFSDEEGEYEGEYNSDKEYHGKGKITFPKSQSVFEGNFVCGVKKGWGEIKFNDGSRMEGNWCGEEYKGIHGKGTYFYDDGGRLESENWKEGSVCGLAEEYDADGALAFRGEYLHGVRHGKGEMFFPEGTSLQGRWDSDALSDEPARYFYPDQSVLEGIWRDGEMASTFYIDENGKQSEEFCEDISNGEIISSFPLLEDPYEKKYVYVTDSTLGSKAGQGLFAKQNLPADFICSFYNGIRLSHEVVDGRHWNDNNNTISIDESTVIDVPAKENDISNYRATLGHKANHSITPNAKYDQFFNHPRFGKIKCIRTLVPIGKDKEIFVDYGYTNGEAPEWYLLLTKRQLQEKNPESKRAKLK